MGLQTINHGVQFYLPPPPSPPSPTGHHHHHPRMTIIMIVSASIFFFFGLFSIYLRCSGNRRGFQTAAADIIAVVNRPLRRAARGLDPSVIQSFPTFLYSTVKGFKIGRYALECAICLNEFEDYETLRLIPKCCHVYHPDCIDAWLSFHNTCAVCRANLIPKPGELTDYKNLYRDINPGQPAPHEQREPGSLNRNGNRMKVLESPDIKLMNSVVWTNKNKPRGSKSTGWRLFGSSATPELTRNPFVEPGKSRERFTLHLPKDVEIRLVNLNLNRSNSFELLPTVQSSRRGYRSGSAGSSSRLDRWEFCKTPPFISRLNSVLSTKDKIEPVCMSTSKGLLKWIKSPSSDPRYSGIEKIGEQSFDYLRSDNQV